MSPAMRQWARDNGFIFTRGRGWTRPDGGFLRDVSCFAGERAEWRHFTKECGYHPTIQPARGAK